MNANQPTQQDLQAQRLLNAQLRELNARLRREAAARLRRRLRRNAQ